MTDHIDHTLYRFFDGGGRLLYVGRTIAPARRWREHERGKPWFEDVASLTREVHATAEAVDAAERAAIASENPLHNIALVQTSGAPVKRSAPKPRATRKAKLAQPWEDEQATTLAVRWASLEGCDWIVLPALECLGDETDCECESCHAKRLSSFEDLRSKYEWHPDLLRQIDAVESAYYAGAELRDWYYDLDDIEMFGCMRLREESRKRPIPAYATIEDAVATVECPFCFANHRHFLTAGTVLDRPVESGCPARGITGRYVLTTKDWLDVRDDQYRWGDESARRSVA